MPETDQPLVIMKSKALLAFAMGGFIAMPQLVAAYAEGDALTMYEAFNKAFLHTSGDTAYFTKSLTNKAEDGSWTLDQDIFMVQDYYELTGDPKTLTLIENLLTTWLYYNPPPWDGDTWNDDIGWYTLGLMRGYQATLNQTYYQYAKTGYDMAFKRGWDTAHNGGGIWELQPTGDGKATKCVLSNLSLSRVACMIYQSMRDKDYLNQCIQIYDWNRKTFFNAGTGEVIGCIVEDGTLQYGDDGYNQGLMADQANMLWLITGQESYLQDAQLAISYGFSKVAKNGIYTNWDPKGTGYTDDLCRGMGRTVQNNRLWSTFHADMVANANSILKNRRADYGITWNAWDTPTPENIDLAPTQAVDAPTWLLWTPVDPPNDVGGIHTITNLATGQAMDSAGDFGSGKSVVQATASGSQNQKWLFTPNSVDGSWNIVNLGTWQALDVPSSNANNATIVQSSPNRATTQRWIIEEQCDGTFKISNQASQKVLDGASTSTLGAMVTQLDWEDLDQQVWTLG